LSPDHDSKLAQVLQSTTSMAVSQVTEPVTLESRHIYVISPSQSLKIVDGKLVPAEMTRSEERRSPVDVFFRTLADAHRSRAVCIVLSGTGANGSIGLRHVKKHGGLTIVQRPDEAEYADMPRNSIATGLVDCVLPIAELPSKIAAYQRMVPRCRRVGAAGEARGRGRGPARCTRTAARTHWPRLFELQTGNPRAPDRAADGGPRAPDDG
jgi:two-component system CheB/CheR fusion protein